MNRIAVLTLAATSLVACDSSTEAAPTCAEDPTQPECRVQQVGAAYVTPAGTVNLISLDGTRFASWSPQSGTFGAAADIATLENGQLPFTTVGAAGTTHDNQDTFLFDGLGRNYTAFEYTPGAFDEEEPFGASNDLGAPDLSDVGAIARAANSSRLFFFDRTGTSYQLWNYGAKTWTAVQSFAADFGGGGAPIASVGAAVYVDGVYYLFDMSGSQWATYLGNLQFEGPFDISELGDGSLDFR